MRDPVVVPGGPRQEQVTARGYSEVVAVLVTDLSAGGMRKGRNIKHKCYLEVKEYEGHIYVYTYMYVYIHMYVYIYIQQRNHWDPCFKL
jgi:hypothetical protein